MIHLRWFWQFYYSKNDIFFNPYGKMNEQILAEKVDVSTSPQIVLSLNSCSFKEMHETNNLCASGD